jgi:hypothetical protein
LFFSFGSQLASCTISFILIRPGSRSFTIFKSVHSFRFCHKQPSVDTEFYQSAKMKYVVSIVSSAALVAAHGYIDNATIGGEFYQFYQPFQDPYMNPQPERISRPVQGNGPIEDITLADLQCGGFVAGGIVGSEPAPLHAPAAAGSSVTMQWTLWPDSHVGPSLTYMARCPDTGCNDWMPGSE